MVNKKIKKDDNNLIVSEDLSVPFYKEGVIFSEKLGPLFENQSFINSQLSAIGSKYEELFLSSANKLGDVMTDYLDSANIMSSNLKNISETVLNNNLINNLTSYSFINEPVISSLSTISDSILFGQEKIISALPSFENSLDGMQRIGEISLINNNNLFQASNIASLNDITLGTLKSEFILPSSVIDSEEISEIKDQVSNLDSKVEKLVNDKNNITLSDITDDVCLELDKRDKDLSKCFKGAIQTLVSESDDYVGQVSESITRIIERLPFLLANKKEFSSIGKEDKVKEAMIEFLNIKEDESDNHYLIMQQKEFYIIFSNLRHRNKDTYSIYSKNKKKFYSLVVMFESFIYILITYKK